MSAIELYRGYEAAAGIPTASDLMNHTIGRDRNNTVLSHRSRALLVGWTLESPGRGTLTLISTCLTTILLCTWVMIHPRVYKSQKHATAHKFAMFFKAIIAPEFIAVEALQEWTQCRRMQRDCARRTGNQFQLVHAFYVSMLGLRYRAPKGEDRVIWPNQYTWLLEQRLVSWEDHAGWGLSVDGLRDKSKADSMAKLIAMIQVSWFVAQSVMRAAHSLPLSQLESMTLGYVPLFAVTYFLWWHKPKDIRSPSIVELPCMDERQKDIFESMAISDKFDEGLVGPVTYWNVWYLTPRLFEKEAQDKAIQDARNTRKQAETASNGSSHAKPETEVPHGVTVSESEVLDSESLESRVRNEKVLAHWDPHLYMSKLWPLICVFGVSFGALHLVAWNTVFPTAAEMWLWRASALVSALSILVFMHFRKVTLRWDGLLTVVSIMSPGLYFLSRVLMMCEAFAALRAESPGVYSTYEVSNYWVHLL